MAFAIHPAPTHVAGRPAHSRGRCLVRPGHLRAPPARVLPDFPTGALTLGDVQSLLDQPEALGLGALAAVVAAGAAFASQQATLAGTASAAAGAAGELQPSGPAPPPRKDAVLVLGGSGKVGRLIVQRAIQSGRNVIAAGRTAEAAETALTSEEAGMGLTAGWQADPSAGALFFEGVDVRDPEALRRPGLWEGVSQVVLVLGGKAGKLPSGKYGYFDGYSPEDVEAKGVANLAAVLPDVLPKAPEVQTVAVVPMGSEGEVAVWERMDDVIMGGNSSSVIRAAPDVGPDVARWTGELIVEGGGFCGARTKTLPSDLSAFDGIALRVKGDGSIFKLNIKTSEQLDSPESTYQATFDTVEGAWHDVLLPWHNFVPVKRAQSDPQGPPLDPSKIAKFGLVLSRFEFNKMPNPRYKAGKFELLLQGGIRAFKGVRPQIVQVSSGGVERNAIIGDDPVKRKADVPIIQLNPGGLLNHKYAAEIAVRSSGYPYCVVRSTGMVDTTEGGPFLLEADQGDRISGTIGRGEVAELVVAALNTPEASYKTFEVRRSQALDGKGKAMAPSDFTRLFLTLAQDRHRWRVGLQPFPAYAPPPTPVTEKRTEEIVQNITEVRTTLKAAGIGIQTEPTNPDVRELEAKAAQAEKEVVSAGSR